MFDFVYVFVVGEVVWFLLIGLICVGGCYEDGLMLVIDVLFIVVEVVVCDMLCFYVGCFDVCFVIVVDLCEGCFIIMEVNGVGFEVVYVWDFCYSVW